MYMIYDILYFETQENRVKEIHDEINSTTFMDLFLSCYSYATIFQCIVICHLVDKLAGSFDSLSGQYSSFAYHISSSFEQDSERMTCRIGQSNNKYQSSCLVVTQSIHFLHKDNSLYDNI